MKLPALTLSACVLAGAATASTTTGFSLDISGNTNAPMLTLTNVGTTGDITGILLSIGDTDYNFDSAHGSRVHSGSLGFTLGAGLDADYNGALRSDTVEFSFSDFNVGEAFRFWVDVDVDNANTVEDYREVMLPGGSITVNFAGGLTSSLTVDLTPEDGGSDAYNFSAIVDTEILQPAAVPLPAGLPLLLAGLGALGIARRKRG